MPHATDSFKDSLHRLRVDAAMDSYVEWREACADVNDAYDGWRSAGRDDAALAFRSYLAALNHEERASNSYERLIRGIEALAVNQAGVQPGTSVPPGERVSDERHDD